MMLWVELCVMPLQIPLQVHLSPPLCPVPENVLLFGSRVAADVFSEDEALWE